MPGPRSWAVAGIDLAWGEQRPDGVCLLQGGADGVTHFAHDLVRGDVELRQWVRDHLPDDRPVLLCLDAPVVCPNRTGSRPVDRLTHRLFHRVQAAAHPANRARCARPLRVVAALRRAGFSIDTDWPSTPRAMVEVYPHPATVRWFGLDCTIKYKRGPVAARRREFARLQKLLRAWLGLHAPELAAHPAARSLLRQPWSKDTEDRTDALLCALIGRGWAVGGRRAMEILGDEQTGFIVLPETKQPDWSATEFPPDSVR
jgi:predicted RNase H-like nuclease